MSDFRHRNGCSTWRPHDIRCFAVFSASLRRRNERLPLLLARLALRTAARSEDIRFAEWGDIDFNQRIWIVPAERSMNRQERRVPLSDSAMRVLRVLRLAVGTRDSLLGEFPMAVIDRYRGLAARSGAIGVSLIALRDEGMLRLLSRHEGSDQEHCTMLGYAGTSWSLPESFKRAKRRAAPEPKPAERDPQAERRKRVAEFWARRSEELRRAAEAKRPKEK